MACRTVPFSLSVGHHPSCARSERRSRCPFFFLFSVFESTRAFGFTCARRRMRNDDPSPTLVRNPCIRFKCAIRISVDYCIVFDRPLIVFFCFSIVKIVMAVVVGNENNH